MLNKHELSLSKDDLLVESLVEIGPVVLEKKSKMRKVYRRTDRETTNDRRSEQLR